MNNTHTSAGVSRRSLAKGAAWAAPAVLATAAVPAYAASRPGTSTSTRGVYFHAFKFRTATNCTSTNPQTGFIDNLPYRSTAGLGDSNRDPSTSKGYWVEGSAGTVTNVTIRSTYTFNYAITLVQNGIDGANVTMPGWTVTQVDSRTITAVYSAPTWNVSTAVAGSGDATGFFFNFRVNNCITPTAITLTAATVMTYNDANGPQTFTKNTGPTQLYRG